MSAEHTELLLDAVERMLSERCTPAVVMAAAGWSEELWSLLEAAGLPLAPVPEGFGGGGATATDALAVARAAARYAAPVPLGETGLLAGRLLAAAGLAVPPGPLAALWRDVEGEPLRLGEDDTVTATVRDVPWARSASRLVLLLIGLDGGWRVATVEPASTRIEHRENIADEPRDTVTFDRVAVIPVSVASDHDADALDRAAALLRAAQIAGALARSLSLSVRYAAEREQFGRPIARFQAVQHMLAELAEETAAAGAVVDHAIALGDRSLLDGTCSAVAVAAVRAAQAAGRGAELAHQIHGAIGYTDEHSLHLYTRRMLAWREEHGGEARWATTLGRTAAAHPGGPWRLLTADDPRVS